jgi:hypothetical protein
MPANTNIVADILRGPEHRGLYRRADSLSSQFEGLRYPCRPDL